MRTGGALLLAVLLLGACGRGAEPAAAPLDVALHATTAPTAPTDPTDGLTTSLGQEDDSQPRCGGGTINPAESTVLETIRGRVDVPLRIFLFSDIVGALPNVTYVTPTRSFSPSELFITGRITTVEAGKSFRWETDGREVRIELPFNDPAAMASTLHMTIEVNQFMAQPGSDPNPTTVEVGVALGAQIDVAKAREELIGLGQIVAILHRSPVFDYEPDRMGVALDGGLLGVVLEDCRFYFPANGVLTEDLAMTIDGLFAVEATEREAPAGW